MVEKICCFITSIWCKRGVISPNDESIYRYGLELLMSTAVNLLCLIGISILLKEKLFWISYLASFIPCRIFGGGYHAQTHLGCILFTIGLYLLAIFSARLVPTNSAPIVCIAITVFLLVTVFALAPVSAHNKPLMPCERKKYRKIALLISLAIFLLSLFFACSKRLLPLRQEVAFSIGAGMAGLSMIVGTILEQGRRFK